MMACSRQTCRAFQRRDVDAVTYLILVTSRATPVETAVLWSQGHFISDALAFTGGEADGKTGFLECRLKKPLRISAVRLAEGKSRSLTHRLPLLYSVCL